MADVLHECVWISGPSGMLRGQLGYRADTRLASGASARAAGTLILSPHPFMGGHMDLPLLRSIADRIADQGLPTLRFDYGGVGESDGQPFDVGGAMGAFWKTGAAPQDPGLIDEARDALAWIGKQVNGPIVLIGYSFGAYVATQIRDESTPAVVLIAPTIAHHDYTGFTNRHLPTLIVAGEGDFATGDEQMTAWADALPGPTRVEQIRDGDHFFRGSADRVAAVCAAFIAGLTHEHAGTQR